MEDFGGSYVKEHLADALLGTAAWLPGDAARAVPRVLLSARRPEVSQVPRRSRAEVPISRRTLYMIDRVDGTARAYFQGLLKLTMIDTDLPRPGARGDRHAGRVRARVCMAAVLAWVPFVGSVIGCVIVVLVAATDFPSSPWVVYAAIGLFLVRAAARRLRVHAVDGRPQPAHASAADGAADLPGRRRRGMPGLILVLPLAGVVMVVAGTIGGIVNDPRLRARHAFAQDAVRVASHHRRPAILRTARRSPLPTILKGSVPPMDRTSAAHRHRRRGPHGPSPRHQSRAPRAWARSSSPPAARRRRARRGRATRSASPPATPTTPQLLAHPGLDAVFLATPTTLHADQIIAALEAGKARVLGKAARAQPSPIACASRRSRRSIRARKR